MNRRGLAPLTAAIALAGCMGPREAIPPQAALAPPAAWREASAPIPRGAAIDVDPAWWQAYGDDTLSRIIEQALADNADIAQAVARIRQAQAGARFARGDLLPSVAASAVGTPRTRNTSPFGTGENLSGYDLEVQASYTLDLFGRLRNQAKGAEAQLLATRAAADTVRLAIVAEAAQTYIQLRFFDASLVIAQRGLVLRQAELTRRETQLRTGYDDRLAVDQAAGEVRTLEATIPNLRTSIRQSENMLSVLIGQPPQAIPRGNALTALALPAPPVMLPARLLRRRPDLYAAEQEIVAADRSLDSARAAFLPDITLSASAGHLDASILPGALNVYSLVGSVLAPIFQGGKLRARTDAATAKRDEAAFAYRARALDAFREVEDALGALDDLAERERATAARAAVAASTLNVAQRRYATGYNSYFEIIAAERANLDAEFALVQVRAARLTATVRLFGALGGGWDVTRIVSAPVIAKEPMRG